MADIAKMIEEIKGMTVLELNSLVKAIDIWTNICTSTVFLAGCIKTNLLFRCTYHTYKLIFLFHFTTTDALSDRYLFCHTDLHLILI